MLHVYLGEQVSDVDVIKGLARKIASNFRLPYFTLTPTFSICPSHGYLSGKQEKCCVCETETEVYSRVVGYLLPVIPLLYGPQIPDNPRIDFGLCFTDAAFFLFSA